MGSAVKKDRGAVLVIGYGNRFRGDDAVGPLVAEAVSAWRLPGVETIAVHQLTPELAARLAGARCVVLVDAATDAATVTCRPVHPSAEAPALGHALNPGDLLGWAMQAFGQAPTAWLLAVPACVFEVGAGLSPAARGGLDEALSRIRRWLDANGIAGTELGGPPSPACPTPGPQPVS